jgi:hypothetical protein
LAGEAVRRLIEVEDLVFRPVIVPELKSTPEVHPSAGGSDGPEAA